MDLMDAINGRRSVRAYQNKPVSKEVIERVLDAGKMAPSALNSQPWLFTAVAGEERQKLIEIITRSSLHVEDMFALVRQEDVLQTREHVVKEREQVLRFYKDLGGAPVLIVVTNPPIEDFITRKLGILSCGAAIENLMLAAYGEGLGTCCVGSSLWVDEEILKVLGLSNHRLITTLSVGYPEKDVRPPKRRNDVVRWLGF